MLRAADLAAATDHPEEDGPLGPHELVLALAGDRGTAGDLLRSYKMKSMRMVG
jgi:hypothetical protein